MASTTTTTVLETIPTIRAAALLELDEGNVVQPLVTNIPFPGPGLTHETPFIKKETAEHAQTSSLSSQVMEATSTYADGSNAETTPSSASVYLNGAYILLQDIAAITSNSDLAALAGQLIGQCIVVRKDYDLVSLFTAISINQGSTTSAAMAPADLYDAYGSLRKQFAPLPYHLVLHPTQIWSSHGLIVLLNNATTSIQSQGMGTVGEDVARYGFSGMVMGFNIWADANIPFTTNTGSGCAFARSAFKSVNKRDFMIEIQRDATEVGDKIVGSEMLGVSLLRNHHGNEMQFPSFDAV